jgi:hypothetical protein
VHVGHHRDVVVDEGQPGDPLELGPGVLLEGDAHGPGLDGPAARDVQGLVDVGHGHGE